MADIPAFEHKQGDTLLLIASVPDTFADGYFAGVTLASQIRDGKDTLVQNLSIEWADPATTRVMRISSDNTTRWPLGDLFFDVQYITASSAIISSKTLIIRCVKDVTRV